MSRFYNPVSVYTGPQGSSDLARDLSVEYHDVEHVLVLTRGDNVQLDPALAQLWAWIRDRESRLKGISLSNPDLKDIIALRSELRRFHAELVVAIGGGSVMDIAKSIVATQRMEIETIADLRTAVAEKSYAEQRAFVPWIGVPTTSGTGSEVTKWATVWDADEACKRSILDDRLYAAKALIVPELTRSLPLKLSASTALDAMSQATEAYWSVRTNPITRVYALSAIERIRKSLPNLISNPEDLSVRDELALGSVLAGLSFSNTQTTACHSISYPLTLLRGIDHGIAVSITLGAILRLNLPSLIEPERMFAAYGATTADEVQTVVWDLFDQFDIPKRLSEFGVTADDIPIIVDGAYTKGRMDNNPIPVTETGLSEILKDLL